MTVSIDDYADDPHVYAIRDITALTEAAESFVAAMDRIEALRAKVYRVDAPLKAARDSLLTDEARDLVALAIRLTNDCGRGPPYELEALARRLDPDWDSRNSTRPTTAKES